MSLFVNSTYSPTVRECGPDPTTTASMVKVRPGIIAVSRDLFDQGWVFGKKVFSTAHRQSPSRPVAPCSRPSSNSPDCAHRGRRSAPAPRRLRERAGGRRLIAWPNHSSSERTNLHFFIPFNFSNIRISHQLIF